MIEFENNNLHYKLKITNTIGQIVYSSLSKNVKEAIDLSFLASGVYYLKVQNNLEQKVFKIIKE
jgi:hypothetical protein